MSDSDRDLARRLRQGLQRADAALGDTAPRTDDVVCDLADALVALEKALRPTTDPAVRAVAGALLGGEDVTERTEMCISPHEPGPDHVGAVLRDDRDQHWIDNAAQYHADTGTSRVWVRTVRRSPWRVVDTGGGEPT